MAAQRDHLYLPLPTLISLVFDFPPHSICVCLLILCSVFAVCGSCFCIFFVVLIDACICIIIKNIGLYNKSYFIYSYFNFDNDRKSYNRIYFVNFCCIAMVFAFLFRGQKNVLLDLVSFAMFLTLDDFYLILNTTLKICHYLIYK